MSLLQRRHGFSANELLVVLIIGLFLLALLIPGAQAMREEFARVNSINCLKKVGLAVWAAQNSQKRLPPAFDKYGQASLAASIHVHLLPYLKEDELYRAYMKQDGKGDAARAKVPGFLASDDPSAGKQREGVQNCAANCGSSVAKG
jgi:hypothetical protein